MAAAADTDSQQSPAKPATDATPAPPRVKEEVTITATPILEGIRVDSLAGTISTVGREQIEDLNAQDIASALRRVPGMAISRYNPVGSYGGGDGGAVFVRGQGAGRPGAEISTMVDGVPKFVGVWTHPLLDLLSVDLVRQVDVYKGAQPVLLGNMAFATVDLVPAAGRLPASAPASPPPTAASTPALSRSTRMAARAASTGPSPRATARATGIGRTQTAAPGRSSRARALPSPRAGTSP